jgi:hypothetical protein
VTNRRLVILGALAIALFLVASILVVDWLTGEPLSAGAGAGARAGPSAETPEAARARAAQATADFLAGRISAGPDLGPPPPPMDVDPGPAPPTSGSWEAVPIVARAGSLGTVGAAVFQYLNELHPALSACAEEEAQSRHATSSISAVQDSQPQDDAGVPVLVLQLETMTDAIRIVDAPVEARGRASDGLLACAQSKLRGRVVEAPGTRGGGRYRMLYTLLP